jgi:dienelactone hydrolase
MKHFSSLLALLFVSSWVLGQTQIPAQFNHVDRLVRGTLSLPSGSGPFPAVVIVPGSGANDRDGTLTLAGGYAPCLYPQLVGQTLRPYRDLGNALVEAGFAVLRYDKLEFSYPTNLGAITFDKLWLPANSALNWLKGRNEIDTNRLILLGHSEGSSLIPWLALQRNDVSALISLAGARTPFDSVLARQLVDFAQQCGGNVNQAQTEASQILTYFNLVRQGPPPPTTPPLFGVPAAVWRTYTQVTDSVAQRYNAAAKPTLFVGLGADLNVPPAELARFQSEVNITNQFWLLPGINHYLSTNSQAAFVPVVADTIVHWLRQQGLASLDPLAMKDSWHMYPNPAVDEVTLNAPAALMQAMPWKLLDMQGRVVKQGYWEAGATEFKLSLNDVTPGLYHLHREMGHAKPLRLLKISR